MNIQENVLNFFEFAQKNSELKEKIVTLSTEAREQDTNKVNNIIKEKLIPLAKEHGFEFTFEDYKQTILSQNNQKKTALNLDDLENISGGASFATICGIGDTYVAIGFLISK